MKAVSALCHSGATVLAGVEIADATPFMCLSSKGNKATSILPYRDFFLASKRRMRTINKTIMVPIPT